MSNIAIIGPAYPYRGGPPLVVAHLYELLSKRHQVEVFSFTRLYPKMFFPGTRQEDVSRYPVKQHPVNRVIDSINPLSWVTAAKQIIASKPDLVVVDWYQPFFGLCYWLITRLLRRKGIRVVYLCENVVSHEARAVDTFLTRAALSQSYAFVVFSQSVEEQLRQWYPTSTIARTTLPLFFTEESSPVAWTRSRARQELGYNGEQVLLFFGYIRKYKGLRNLISAFAEVHQQCPRASLLIVGECYENEAEYRELITASAARDRIRWINEYVANEDVALYYSAADIVVLPYVSATQSGIVKIAFGFGKAILATRVGGLAEEIGRWEAGNVVEPGSVESLRDGLVSMLSEDNLTHYEHGSLRAKKANAFEDIVPMVEQFLPS